GGDQLLAGPRFALYQNRYIDRRHALDPPEQRLHRDAPTDDPVKRRQVTSRHQRPAPAPPVACRRTEKRPAVRGAPRRAGRWALPRLRPRASGRYAPLAFSERFIPTLASLRQCPLFLTPRRSFSGARITRRRFSTNAMACGSPAMPYGTVVVSFEKRQ